MPSDAPAHDATLDGHAAEVLTKFFESLLSKSKANAEESAATPDDADTNVATPDEAKEADEPPAPAPQPAEPGTHVEYKRVDHVYDKESSEWIYRDSAPVSRKDEDNYRNFSFTIVREFSRREMLLESTLIELKNQHLKAACREVIGNFSGISWDSRPLRIDPQVFIAFFPGLEEHSKALSAQASRTEDEETAAAHLKLFVDFLALEYGEQLREIANMKEHGIMTFSLLWSIYLPRTLLYTTCSVTSEPRAVRLVSADMVRPGNTAPFWRLNCEYIDAAGKHAKNTARFGFADVYVDVFAFKGTAPISALRAYPFQWHPRGDEMKQRLIARGKHWASLDGIHHQAYNSVAYTFRQCRYIKVTVNSRIMVDLGTFKMINPNYNVPSVKGIPDNDTDEAYDTDEDGCRSGPSPAYTTLPEDLLMLTPAVVYGFSLSDKLWLEFNVVHVKDFEWNEEAFKQLVLPPTQKMLIKSLVESHRAEGGFDDFIEGKGRGLIINLFGPPGVGKTMSAEATSEHVRRPLYVVGAGDLGTYASQLDDKLTEIFDVAATWGAVVLIDEADVFLEQRSLHDIDRNAMVAVFLRQLEYFRGILFLTTNRVKTFDEAFQSRIHVALHYKDLDASAKRQIWFAFLAKVGLAAADVTDAQAKTLAEQPLNGRQIKNAVRTADAVASSRGEKLSFDHVRQVLDVMEQFEEEFKALGRLDSAA